MPESVSSDHETVRFHSLGENAVGALFCAHADEPQPCMLICHGAGEFKENYFELAKHLAGRGIAALAIDMHGHGNTGGERFHVSMREWVADVQAGVDFLSNDTRIDPECIGAFGLSSGGTAILEAALVEPRLKALVALDPTVRNAQPFVHTVAVWLLFAAGKLKKWVTGSDLRVPLAKGMGNIRLTSDPQVEQRLRADPRLREAFNSFPFPGAVDCFFVHTLKRAGAITAPTLVLWGAEDELDPPETGRMLFEALRCPKSLRVVPGNGHLGHLDRNREQVFALTSEWALQHLRPLNKCSYGYQNH